MKAHILKIALVLAELLGTPAVASDAPNAHLNLLGNTFMNLRSCPATTASCPAMLEMPDNALVTIILDRGDWTRIGVTGSDGKYYEGFVKSKFVEQGAAPTAPAPQAATPAPAPAQSALWQQAYNNCKNTDLTKDLTAKQTENFCSCVASSIETVQNGSSGTKEQKIEQIKPMISECSKNALTVGDTSVATAAPANDCVDELRLWQREETQITEMQMSGSLTADDMMSITAPSGFGSPHPTKRACEYTNKLANMYKHQAAYYRHCEAGIDGEKQAHKAEQESVVYLSTSRKAQCPTQ